MGLPRDARRAGGAFAIEMSIRNAQVRNGNCKSACDCHGFRMSRATNGAEKGRGSLKPRASNGSVDKKGGLHLGRVNETADEDPHTAEASSIRSGRLRSMRQEMFFEDEHLRRKQIAKSCPEPCGSLSKRNLGSLHKRRGS